MIYIIIGNVRAALRDVVGEATATATYLRTEVSKYATARRNVAGRRGAARPTRPPAPGVRQSAMKICKGIISQCRRRRDLYEGGAADRRHLGSDAPGCTPRAK